MAEKVLVLDGVHKDIIPMLESEGYGVTYLEKKEQPSPAALSGMLKDFDAFAIRSFNLKGEAEEKVEIPSNVQAIGRAGAGVNNIPFKELRERGIVVFNTPGANANSVKELVLGNLIAVSRNLYESVNWADALTQNVAEAVEKGKKKFTGREIFGKTIGVVGLGHIGRMVARDAAHLGMHVIGYDPFLSADKRDELAARIRIVGQLGDLLADSDYVTLHVAYDAKKNKDMLDDAVIGRMKSGAVLLNFARGELVNNEALKRYLNEGILSRYVTDFPCDELVGIEGVVRVPHLGASTEEAEKNCAAMIARQLDAYFRHGEIHNSVNYPATLLSGAAGYRLAILVRDRPGLIKDITGTFSKREINIEGMTYGTHDGFGCFLGNSNAEIPAEMFDELGKINGFIRARVIGK